MKSILIPAAATALLFTACVESGLNDTDTVVVTGKALKEDKTPLAEATLKLHRGLNSACLLPDHFEDVTTDAEGAYTFELQGSQTKNGDIARCFQLRVPADETGASVSVDFLMQVTEVAVPDLQLWNGAVEVGGSGDGASVTFEPIQTTHGESAGSTHRLVVSNDEGAAWASDDVSSPAEVSAYALEDFAGLKARLHTGAGIKGSGQEFKLFWSSSAVEVPQKALVPLSRDQECQIGTRVYDTACPYTDGKLTPVLESGSDLRIDLATPSRPNRVVLRGFRHNINAKVLFEGSNDDGVTWTALGELDAGPLHDFVEAELTAPQQPITAFRIRVEGENDPKIVELNEISLFD